MGRMLLSLQALVYLSVGGGKYRVHSDILHVLSEEDPLGYNHGGLTLRLLPQFPQGAEQAFSIQLLKIQQ